VYALDADTGTLIWQVSVLRVVMKMPMGGPSRLRKKRVKKQFLSSFGSFSRS
jgi:PQQ enzyme repeat